MLLLADELRLVAAGSLSVGADELLQGHPILSEEGTGTILQPQEHGEEYALPDGTRLRLADLLRRKCTGNKMA